MADAIYFGWRDNQPPKITLRTCQSTSSACCMNLWPTVCAWLPHEPLASAYPRARPHVLHGSHMTLGPRIDASEPFQQHICSVEGLAIPDKPSVTRVSVLCSSDSCPEWHSGRCMTMSACALTPLKYLLISSVIPSASSGALSHFPFLLSYPSLWLSAFCSAAFLRLV